MAEQKRISKKDLAPVVYLPKDPENIRLSYNEFVAKRRKQKELKAKAERIIREETEKEVNSGVQEVKEKKEEVKTESKPKRGRPAKVE